MSYFEGYQQTVFFDFPTLTAPGVTDSVDVYITNYLSTRNYTFVVIVNSLHTHVDVNLEGSLDGINFGVMRTEKITANGTYAYNVSGFPVKKIRANFISESGGHNATVKFNISAN